MNHQLLNEFGDSDCEIRRHQFGLERKAWFRCVNRFNNMNNWGVYHLGIVLLIVIIRIFLVFV